MGKMKAAVMGGGNGSHTIAADLALKGVQVSLFEMPVFADRMQRVFETHEIEMSGVAGSGKARLARVTSDIEAAVDDVAVIFIPLPGFAVSPYAKLLAPHLRESQIVVLMPGTLSALEFRHTLNTCGHRREVVIAETGGLPFATRLVAPGKVCIFHIRSVCGLAAFPGNRGAEAHELLKGLYPLQPKRTVVETGLGHLTPLLHPAGCLLNAGCIERAHGEFYMYEEGMTPSVVRVIEEVDRERLTTGRRLGVDLPTAVDMMVESGYGPRGTLWESLNGSAGLTPIKGPDSLKNRYVTEDVPFGLVAWSSLARSVGVETPAMDALISLGSAVMGTDCRAAGRNLRRMGLEGLGAEEIMTYLETGLRQPEDPAAGSPLAP